MTVVAPVLPAAELLPIPERGRRFSASTEVRLGDVDPAGRLRLDATVRFLQDIATDDARAAELPNPDGWVVRRTMMAVTRPAVLAERLTLTTYCTGIGRCWAERATTIVGDQGAALHAVSLWVQVDTATGRPLGLGAAFVDRYAEAAAGRVVSTRLSLPAPPVDAHDAPWSVRLVDLDVFGHVNNAVAWATLEELIAGTDAPAGDDGVGVGEVEYRGPLDRGDVRRLVALDGHAHSTWLIAPDGSVRVAARWTPTAR